jgi:uncharacterized protein
MNQAIQDFVNGKNLAIVGVSRNGSKFGNMIFSELKQRGYQMWIIHPEAQEIAGAKCYPNLAAVQGKVDGVVINLPPRQTEQVLRDAVKAGIRNIWIQQGADSPEVSAIAQELGVQPISGKCILMYAPPVQSFHSWHRAFMRLIGQL